MPPHHQPPHGRRSSPPQESPAGHPSPPQRALRRVTARIADRLPHNSRSETPERRLRRVTTSIASVPRGSVSVVGAAENVASEAALRTVAEDSEPEKNLLGENEREKQVELINTIKRWLGVDPEATSSNGMEDSGSMSTQIDEVSEKPEPRLCFSPRFGTYFCFTNVYQEGGTEVEMTVRFRSAILNGLPGIRAKIASSEFSRCAPWPLDGRRRRRRRRRRSPPLWEAWHAWEEVVRLAREAGCLSDRRPGLSAPDCACRRLSGQR